jgi:transposase-like protein
MEPNVPRWTAKRKAEVVLQIIKREKSVVDICRENDLRQSEVKKWIEMFLKGGERHLKVNSKDEQAQHRKETKEMRAKIGELVLEIDILKKAKALMEEEQDETS